MQAPIKSAINTAAVHNPDFVAQKLRPAKVGAQCIVVAMDVKTGQRRAGEAMQTVLAKSRLPTAVVNPTGHRSRLEWAKRMATLGAGEILLLTSMDRDGTKRRLRASVITRRHMPSAVDVPVIASGGVGTLEHLAEGVTGRNGADAVLAASIFHFGEHTIPEAKAFMAAQGIEVRL